VGCQQHPTECIISRAVREFFPRATVLGHSIFPDKTGVCGTELEFRKVFDFIELPEIAHQLMNKFDACVTANEVLNLPLISFDVEVPERIEAKLLASIGLSEVYKILSESKTLELVQI
jgi:hypothetical protein